MTDKNAAGHVPEPQEPVRPFKFLNQQDFQALSETQKLAYVNAAFAELVRQQREPPRR